MVHREPPLGVVIPSKQREIRDPAERMTGWIAQTMFARDRNAKTCDGRQNSIRGIGDDQEEITLGDFPGREERVQYSIRKVLLRGRRDLAIGSFDPYEAPGSVRLHRFR